MRWIIRILGVLILTVVVLAALAFALPRQVTVERSVAINAAPQAIFPHVNSMQKTEAWSPWLHHDPDVQLNYDGPETGTGNTLTWISDHPNVGNGTQVITASVENERVETALDFGAMGTADAFFALEPEGEATNVTWGFTTDTKYNPMARWMGLMMDKWVGADYERGLANLKALVEAG